MIYTHETIGNITIATITASEEGKKIDLREVNLLRRSIMGHVRSFAIEYVTFYENSSVRDDEILALRLGLVPIHQVSIAHDDIKYDDSRGIKVIFGNIDVFGPKIVTTSDIMGFTFLTETPIVTLLKDQRLSCDLIATEGYGDMHAKWRPCGPISITESKDTFKLKFKGIGILSGDEILKQGVERINEAAMRRPPNKFFAQVLPPNMINLVDVSTISDESPDEPTNELW